MRIGLMVGGMLLSGAMVVGCNSTEDKPVVPPAPSNATQRNVDKAQDAAKDTMDNAADAAKNAANKGKDAMNDAVDATKDAANQAADSSSAMVKEAQAKLDEAMTYIKENKLDMADKALTQVEKMKDSLTPALQTQLANARKMLDTARNAPAMPTMPGNK